MAKKKISKHAFAGILAEPVSKPRPKRRKPRRDTDPYKRWLEAMADWRAGPGLTDSQRPPDDIAERLRDAEIDLLLRYAKGELSTIPVEVAYHLAQGIQTVHQWQDQTYLLPARLRITHRQTKKPTLFCEGLIQDAVRYVRAAQSREIDDPHYCKTVAYAFGVAERTVQRWCKRYNQLGIPNLNYPHSQQKGGIAISGAEYQRRFPYRVVRPGETLYTIAREAGLDYRGMALWNGLEPPYRLEVGQSLVLVEPESSPEITEVAVEPSTAFPKQPQQPRKTGNLTELVMRQSGKHYQKKNCGRKQKG